MRIDSISRKIYCLIIFVFVSMSSTRAFAKSPDVFSEGLEEKGSIVNCIKEITPIMTNVDITIRNIGLNMLPITEGVKRLDTYVAQIELLQCHESLLKQRKMILLSFKKLRIGLLLLSPEKKRVSVELIKSGTRLLKRAAMDIVDIAEKEGITREKDMRQGEASK